MGAVNAFGVIVGKGVFARWKNNSVYDLGECVDSCSRSDGSGGYNSNIIYTYVHI